MKSVLKRLLIVLLLFSTPITLSLYALFDYLVRNHMITYEVKLFAMIFFIVFSVSVSLMILFLLNNQDKNEQLELSKFITELSDDAVLVTDKLNRIIYANEKFLTMTEYNMSDIYMKNPRMFQSGRQDKAFYDLMWTEIYRNGAWEGDIWDRKKTGEVYPKRTKILVIKSRFGKIKYHLSIQRDISAFVTLREEKEKHEFFDFETMLPNEKSLTKQLNTMLEQSEAIHNYYARIVNRPQIEARIGRLGYNDVLIKYADKVNQMLKGKGILAEIDKNTLVISIDESCMFEIPIIEQLIQLSNNIAYHEMIINLEFKYGISVYPIDGNNPYELISKAQMALNYTIDNPEYMYYKYHSHLESILKQELELHTALSQAIDNNEIIVYYQPQVNAETNKTVGVEALLRWHSKTLGMIQPNTFIPIAEKYGYIKKFDLFVLEQAIRDYPKLSTYQENLLISVNVSTIELLNDAYFEAVKSLLEQSQFPREKLVIELTEGRTIKDIDNLITYTKKLRELGVQIALDDFGTGFNSIASMMDMKLDELKIDRSFIKGYPAHSGSLTKSVIKMGEALNLRVITEGVETIEQRDFLLKNGCVMMQGYLYSKPIPIDQLLTYLKKELE
ncbi:MAG: EAL domain-containing protein [Acholeplasma sp.]|jgi:PAS domain S-box-containing protein|nr:EAL domain-containing protein [Acholeplasma sp.]